MSSNFDKKQISNYLLICIGAFIFGLILIIVNTDYLTSILFTIIGVLLIIFSLEEFIRSCKNLKYKTAVAYNQFITSLLHILLAVSLICFQNLLDIVTLVVGLVLIITSIISIAISKNNYKEELSYQLPSIILGLILLIFRISGIVGILIKIIGWIILVASIIYFLYFIAHFKRK